jgi:hypothetical protein
MRSIYTFCAGCGLNANWRKVFGNSSINTFGALALALLLSNSVAASTIFSENFSASNGAISGINWYLDLTGCSVSGSSYLRINANKLEARDTDCEATFYTYPIDISQYRNVSLSVELTESGNLSSSDRIQTMYSIDGGAFQYFTTNGNRADDFTSATASQTNLSGKTIVIKLIAENNSSSEYYRIDNLLIEGDAKDNFSLSASTTNVSCSTAGAIDLVVTPGASASSTTSPYGTGSCTVTMSGSSSYTLNSGQVGCVTGSFSGSVTLNGGTMINAGSASISSLNFNSGTFINNGTLSISNFTTSSGRVVYNYGTMAVSGALTIGDAFYNFGSISAGSLTINTGGRLINNNNIQVNGDFINNANVINNGSIATSGNITNNSGSSFTNNGNITGNTLTQNASLDNHGSISVNTFTTINSSGSLIMNSGAALSTNSITLNGSITNTGTACANIAVGDYTRVNSSGSMSGNVQLCDANGVDLNYSSSYSGGAALNCNCSGGGYTYLWSNGATTQDLSGLAAGTYTVTVTGPNGTTATTSATITGSGASGNPAVFGSNQWIVYAWNAGDASGGNGAWTDNYSGYYTISSLNFDTRTGQTYSTAQSWDDNNSPSSASGYVGCSVGNDTHSYAFKRQGFPVGTYTINLPNHDDRVQLYVDGVKVYDQSTCCASRSNIWTGSLGAASQLELRISEGWGGSHGSIELVAQASPTVTNSTAASRCGTGTVTLQATASSGAVIDWYAAATGGSVLSGGTGTNSFTTPSIGSTTTYFAQARHTSSGAISTARTAVIATINSAPSASISGNQTICAGGSSTFTATGGGTYLWSTGATTAAISVNAAATYTVTVTNASGCTAAASRALTVNSAPAASVSGTNSVCAGSASTFTATGGGTYLWSNGATTAAISVSAAGTYTATVTSASGCTATANRALTVNSAPSASVSGTQTICAGGSSTFTATGGSTYLWSTGATTAAISISAAGTYTVTVTNASGCTASASRALTVNSVPSASVSGNQTICAGGSSTFTATGGGNYLWSTGATSAAISVSSAATYTVTVTNASGCTATANRALTVNALPTASISGTQAICTGGSSTFTAIGGGTYLWSTGATTAAVSVTTAGTYTVTVTNASGCTATANRTLTINTIPSASITGTNVNCHGQSTGAATLAATGGTAPYTYNWGGGVTTQNRTSLAAGSYTVTVTAASGCTTSALVTISQPVAALAATSLATSVTCGFCTDGSASVNVTGGTAPYTYLWSTSAITSNITGRAPGTYTVTITDNLGCTITSSAVVNLPLQIRIAGASACTAGSGSATASGIGGTSPYTFVWSTGATTATISSLGSGTYHVTGTDANGVTATQSVVISNTNIVASLSPASATICQGQQVQLTASGADVYSWSPSTGLSNASIANPIANPTVTTTYSLNVGATSGQLVTNGDFSNGNTGFTSAYGYVSPPGNGSKLYPEGLYAVDSNANTYHGNFFGRDHTTGNGNYMIINGATLAGQDIWSQTVNITSNTNYNFSTWITSVNTTSPAQLRFEINGVLLGPVITAPSTLNTWVQFNTSWNSGSATSAVISIVNENAAAGGNDYGLDDINFTTVCNVNYGSVTVNVSPRPTANAGSDVSICTGESATLTATGAGSGGSYLWSNGATTASTTVSPTATTPYAVTVTNASGCAAVDSVLVTFNTRPSVSVSGTNVLCYGATTGAANTTVTGGTTPYSYNWSGGVTTQNRTGLAAGNYTVTVTAASGCTVSGSVSITQPTAAISLSSTSINPTSAGNNGSINLTVAGGTGPYAYNWSNGLRVEDLTALGDGTYSVTVTDASGCTATRSVVLAAPVPCVCIASGNWTNPSVWSGNCSGGHGQYAGYLDDIEIKGFQVVVDSTHTVKSLVLRESASAITKLSYTNSNSLDILNDFNLNTISTGNNVEIDIDGSAEMIVDGDFYINHARGTNVTIKLNANNGNNAKFRVNGNLDMTMATGSGDLFINTYAAFDTIQIIGNILFKNNNTSSGSDMIITMASSSILLVGGDIDFNGVRNQNMELILNNSSILELSGSIIRKASPSKFGKITMNSTSSLIFAGSDQQIWEGTTGNTDNNTYISIIIRNTAAASPQVLLNGDVTVTSTLTFEDGNAGTGNNMLIISSTSANAITGHNANSYVVGTLRRYIASNNASYDFPLGYGGPNEYYWARITNNFMVGPSYLTASFGVLPAQERGNAILVSDATMTYTELKQEGIWTIDPNTQPLLGSYTITVGTENFSGLMDNMFRVIKRPTGSGIGSWSNGSGLLSILGAADRLVSAGLTSLGGLTSFSEFGVAQGGGESLPIDLVSFGAQPDGTRVRLDWTVSMEINNDYFTIERSLDGVDFEPVAEVQGGGNHSIETDYQTYDENPEMGLSYYRLKQTDFDGQFKVYDMVSVMMTSTASTSFDIYPNPNKGSFTISLDTPFDRTNVMVLNAMGQMVYINELVNTTGKTKTQLDLGDVLATGIYFVKVDTGKDTFIKQMVIE